MLKFPSELKLILCCIKDSPTVNFKLTDDFNWNFFIELVAKHKVENIVNNKLPLLVKNTPNKVSYIVRRLSNKARIRNLMQAKLLKELVQAFDKHKLEALFVKGLTTYSLYPNEKYLRPARDIDFIIDWQDVDRTLDILAKMDFKLITKSYKKSMGSLDLRLKNSSILLELHWNLWSKREEIPSNFPQLWQNRDYISRYNVKIPTIDQATHIDYLCYHGFSHFWYRLFWLVDIHLILKNKDINWHAVVEDAKARGTLPALYLALALAADLFQAKLPAVLEDNLIEKTSDMRQEIYQVLTNNPSGTDLQPKNLKQIWQRIKWKLSGKSKYRLRTLIKLLLIR